MIVNICLFGQECVTEAGQLRQIAAGSVRSTSGNWYDHQDHPQLKTEKFPLQSIFTGKLAYMYLAPPNGHALEAIYTLIPRWMAGNSGITRLERINPHLPDM